MSPRNELRSSVAGPSTADAPPSSMSKVVAVYGMLLVVTLVGLLGLLRLGPGSSTGGAGARAVFSAKAAHPETLLHVLIALVVIVAASRLLGALFRVLAQPPVVGEIIAGILLGPSLLGRLSPDVAAYVFPPEVVPLLGILAQLGVILFMFLVGVDLDVRVLRQKSHVALAISHASIMAPLLSGAALALWLYPRVSTPQLPFEVFALFFAVAMSITAFPVLARILTDRNMQHTPLGVLALSCAAIDDVTAWCLLAVVVGIAQSSMNGALYTIGLMVVFLVLIFAVVRPLVRHLVRTLEARTSLGRNAIAAVLLGLLVMALATEYIGVHAIFGAFLAGVNIPHESKCARELKARLEDFANVLLLPIFFASIGLRTQIDLMNGGEAWVACGAIVLVACAGKLGGTYAAARFTGVGTTDAIGLGILMNTRGLMELVVLNIGLELGVVSPTLFAMMVIMTLVTTSLAPPVLAILMRARPPRFQQGLNSNHLS